MKAFKKFQLPMYYKIMLSFLGLMTAFVVILIVANNMAQNNAEQYMQERLAIKVNYAIEQIVQEMDSNDWTIDDEGLIQYIVAYTQRLGIKLEVYNEKDQLIYSNAGPQKDNPVTIEKPAQGTENSTDEQYEIVYQGTSVGYVQVRTIDIRSLGKQEERFFGRNSEVFRNSIFATFLITLSVSFIVARSITVPLKKVSETAVAISDGNLKARTDVTSNTTEINELSTSINHLASTLEREDGLRKQVTSDMAHEIRTPLTSLRNFFEAFIDGVYEPNQTNMIKCHEEIIRMADLVDRLKDLATIEAMNASSHKLELNIATEVRTMCDLLMPEFKKKQMSLSSDLDDDAYVVMDQNHLRQIVSNLLTNANRYTDEGGEVGVNVSKKEGIVILSVYDTGIGMSEEDRLNIFERFYRADKSRDRATGGMGVGLTIVKTLVETYGGSIEVVSVLGEGSTFVVKLPV